MRQEDIKTLKAQIRKILKEFPKTRNSDKLLTMRLWEKFYVKLLDYYPLKRCWVVKIENIMELPAQDSIKRIRAWVQNGDKEFLPTNWEVAEKRGWKEEVWKKAIGYNIQEDSGQFELRL